MKLPQSNICTEAHGALKTTSFGINTQDAGMIFDILRSKLYTDPILALCREYASNARDAHREVGTPNRPIEIHLPNAWSSDFKIKDYGPGLSPDRVENIFTKYGSSTKRESNDQLGAFGIGSKSGWSYADSFTVLTVVDGVEYTYSAYIDETKVGKMDLLQKSDTDQPNGTTIVIPVSKYDYSSFESRVGSVTKWWDVRPDFIGSDFSPPQKPPFTLSGKGWGLVDPDYRVSEYSIALIDGIAYLISSYSLSNRSDLHSAILGNGLAINFNIGELSLAASRDTIHYDDSTQKAILERLDQIADELVEIFSDKIKNATSYSEACNALATAKNNLRCNSIINTLSGIQWQGHDIQLKVDAYKSVGKWTKVVNYAAHSSEDRVVSSRKSTLLNFIDKNNVIYHNDLKTKTIPRYLIEALVEKSPLTIQIVTTQNPPSSSQYIKELQYAEKNDTDKPEVKYDLDILKLIGAKSLQAEFDLIPKVERKAKVRKSIGKTAEGHIKGYKLCYSYNEVRSTPTFFPKTQGGLYIVVDPKEKATTSGDLWIDSRFSFIKDLLKKEIVGFSLFREKKLGSEWVPVHVALKEKLEEYNKEITVDELTQLSKESNFRFEFYLPGSLATNVGRIDSCSPLAKWINKSKEVQEQIGKYKYLHTLHSIFGTHIDHIPAYKPYDSNVKHLAKATEMGKLCQETLARYPLLNKIGDIAQNIEHVISYINMIDEKLTENNVVQLKPTGT